MLKLIPFYGTLLGADLYGTQKATQSHVLIYGAVEAHAMGELGCIASNKTIAAETGLSISRVANLLSELSKAKWVSVNLDEKNHRLGIVPNLTLTVSDNPPSRLQQPPLTADGTIYNNIDNNIEKGHMPVSVQAAAGASPTPPTPSPRPSEILIFTTIAKILHPTRDILFTETRRHKLRKRMENFKPSQIQVAAKNLMQSDFHTGNNDTRTVYASFDFLLRNDEKVEEWLNKTPAQIKKVAF